jgi:hypothetical protein
LIGETAPSRIKTGTTHFQGAATLLNRDRLLLQQVNKRVTHFNSRAKKTGVFLKNKQPYEVDDFLAPVGGHAIVQQ